MFKLTNWLQLFMLLSCYWSWTSSQHCQVKVAVDPQGDPRMKTWRHLFFTITNCQIVRSRSLHSKKYKFMCLSQWACENLCCYRRKEYRGLDHFEKNVSQSVLKICWNLLLKYHTIICQYYYIAPVSPGTQVFSLICSTLVLISSLFTILLYVFN